MPSREEGKDLRRKAILAAARELIRGKGETGFSMRALSERTGLSIATPYNLFGSKQAIMHAMLDDDIGDYAEQLSRSKVDALDLVFEAVTLGNRFFGRDQAYYRAVLGAVYSEGGPEYRERFGRPRRAVWLDLVSKAANAGYLQSDLECEPFSVNISTIYFGNILEWVAGEITLEGLEAQTHYGFGLALLGMVKPLHRRRVHERVVAAQRLLVRKRVRPKHAQA